MHSAKEIAVTRNILQLSVNTILFKITPIFSWGTIFFFQDVIWRSCTNLFCKMLIQVLYIKVISTLYVNKRNWKYIGCGLFSYIQLWYALWVLTNSKIAGNCFHLFVSKGAIWGDTWANTQLLDLWISACSHCCANRS